MSLPTIQLYPVLHVVGVDSGGSPEDVLLSTVTGRSAAADTPSSVPYLPVLRDQAWVSWSCLDRSEGWPDIGGYVRHGIRQFTTDSKINEVDKTSALDILRDLKFKGQQAILYACAAEPSGDARGWKVPALADCQEIFRGTVEDGLVRGDVFSLRVREQTEEGLDVPTTPIQFLGLGSGVAIEDGGTPSTGARIVRADQPAIRGTGDQAFAWTLSRGGGDSGTANYSMFASPIARLRRKESNDTLKIQMRNAAGTWVDVGANIDFQADTLRSVLVNYKSSSTTAEGFIGGVSVGSTSITGGPFAASAANTTWHNAPTVGSMVITHFFFRHWGRELAAGEISDLSQFSLIFDDVDLNCAIEFDRGIGTLLGDDAGFISATMIGFADANGAWNPSGTGEPSVSRKRPRAVKGRPFQARLELIGLASQLYTIGYEDAVNLREARFVTSNGQRMRATISESRVSAFLAASQQVTISVVDQVALPQEPAIGQLITFSAGANAGAHRVDQILHDPVAGQSSANGFVTLVLADPVVDSSDLGSWTASGRWDLDTSLTPGLSAVLVDSGTTDRMGASFNGRFSDGGQRLASAFLEHLGPEAAPTIENLRSISLGKVGWQGDGNATAAEHADFLAKATPSADDGPSLIFRNHGGGWVVRGSKRSPSSLDFTFRERDIEAVDVPFDPARQASVRVRYAENFSHEEGLAGVTPRGTSGDRMASESLTRWREVVVPPGGGAPELTVETAFLLPNDAKLYGAGILEILQDGQLRVLRVRGPLTKAQAAMLPFDEISATWSADPLLASGAIGILVGMTLFSFRDDIGADLTVLFV